MLLHCRVRQSHIESEQLVGVQNVFRAMIVLIEEFVVVGVVKLLGLWSYKISWNGQKHLVWFLKAMDNSSPHLAILEQ